MPTEAGSNTKSEEREAPGTIVTIALGQVLLSFNVVSLPIALSGLVKSFGVPPTTVAAAIVTYSLAVASFVMLGAKLNQRFGAVSIFRAVVALFGAAQVLMTVSPNANVMIAAQGLCGAAGAVLVPSLVMLVAKKIPVDRQTAALGMLGAAGAGGAVAALLIGGFLGTRVGWRPAFGILAFLSVVAFTLSLRLKRDKGVPNIQIDVVGVILAAAAVILISLGFNNMTDWGAGLAGPNAPFDILGVSPAPIMAVVGVVFGQAFVSWTRRRRARRKTPLFAIEVMQPARQRAAVYVLFAVGALEAMLNFAMPLYIQVVQGRSPLETAIAMIPFNLSVFVSALFVVKLYDRFSLDRIARCGLAICAIALFWLALVARNDWSTIPVVIGLVAFGLSQGALMTLIFNVMVVAAPADLAGDVGALRGTTQNLGVAIGTAVAGALLVGVLSSAVLRNVAASELLPSELVQQFDLNNVNFVSNDRLRSVLARMNTTDVQIEEAVRINSESRLRALKIGFLVMGCLALVMIGPAGRLPKRLKSKAD